MLLLDSKTRIIDGITVLPDHADETQYYYLPLTPHLTTIEDPETEGARVPQFSLIRYRGEAGTGGFLNFDVNLGVGADQIDNLRRAIQQEEDLDDLPRIAPITVVGGSVRLLMLGHKSGDDTTGNAGNATDGEGPDFVLRIDHSTAPALYGSNQAAFSVELDSAGVAVIERALEGEILPIAVVYSLDYLGLRPAYAVRLHIDWERVQKHMDERFGGGSLFSSVEISNTVDELVEQRAIVLESDTFVTDDEENQGVIDRRDAALAQVRSMITDAFFQPTLPPMEPGKEEDWEKALRAAAGVVGAIGMGPAGGMAASTFFSYSKTNYKRVDQKKLNVNFSERVAIQRSIHPQGHLAGLFRLLRDTTLSMDRFIQEVNLDDPWFARRQLRITSNADFEHDGISSINVRARYGNEPKNVLLTRNSPEAELHWASLVEGGAIQMPVEYEFEVAFEGVDTTERPRAVTSEPRTCSVQELPIAPRDLYTMMPVPIVPIDFPWETYPMVEVHVRYRDTASGLDQGDVLRLDKETSETTWNAFVLDPSKSTFEYRIVYRGADNRDVDTGWKASDAEQISLRDPFPRKRRIQVVPNLNWAEVERCFVDLRYEDRANNILDETSFEFTQGSTPQSHAIALEDPQRKQVFFKVLILFKDGRMVEVPESVTLDRRIIVRTDMRGHRIVEIRPPAAFDSASLKRVIAQLRFEDFEAGLSFADTFVFEDPEARGYFEFDYVDEERDRYEMRTNYLFDNGLERATEWQAMSGTLQRIEAA